MDSNFCNLHSLAYPPNILLQQVPWLGRLTLLPSTAPHCSEGLRVAVPEAEHAAPATIRDAAGRHGQ